MDINNLEATPYPFKVKKIFNMEGAEDGEMYNGYLITMTVDPQDAIGNESIALQQFPYEAVVENVTEVDVTAPYSSTMKEAVTTNSFAKSLKIDPKPSLSSIQWTMLGSALKGSMGQLIASTRRSTSLRFLRALD